MPEGEHIEVKVPMVAIRLDGWQIKCLHSFMIQVGVITQEDELVLSVNTTNADVEVEYTTREGVRYQRTLEAEDEG